MEIGHAERVASSTGGASSVQVCDRCRWKKIKCDAHFSQGNRLTPCSNCRNANFPCEARARLSKQSTPRSYVQYLESRVRHLEQGQENAWSPKASSSQHSQPSPYGDGSITAKTTSASPPSSTNNFKPVGAPDWTVLKELGMHVVDSDGFSRYMGPASGVGFSTMVLQEILGNEQPTEPEFSGLYTVDDFTRGKALEEADGILRELVPTDLPDRAEADRILGCFFLFTERIFPILHRPSFQAVINELYSLDPITTDSFEHLSQFYFCLSIGYCFDLSRKREERIKDQIFSLEMACKCHFITPHTRRDGLTRLQTLSLQAYALIMLRQRSTASRISAAANMKALECGLHHDGNVFAGNPLDTEMRRRVFWCVFMLNLFSSSFLGLPRALHEADITIAEPSDIDDDCLTPTRVLAGVPGRTKIHRFVTVCRLIRILSRTLDVLYTHNKRKHASTRIEQMNRLCCEHLLDQLNFSFDEVPDDLPDADTQDPHEMAIVISYANEQLLYHYIRWLIHRPGLALARSEAQFTSCLQTATEAAANMLELLDLYAHLLPLIKSSPVAHHMTIFMAALTPLYRTYLLRSQPMTIPAPPTFTNDDQNAVQHGINAIRNELYDRNDVIRADLLVNMVSRVFGQGKSAATTNAVRVPHVRSQQYSLPQVTIRQPSSERSPLTEESISVRRVATHAGHRQPMQGNPMDWSEHRIAHLTAHADLRDLVHDVFSPAADPWASQEGDQYRG